MTAWWQQRPPRRVEVPSLSGHQTPKKMGGVPGNHIGNPRISGGFFGNFMEFLDFDKETKSKCNDFRSVGNTRNDICIKLNAD